MRHRISFLLTCAAAIPLRRFAALRYDALSSIASSRAGHPYIRPKAIHDRDIVEEAAGDYMYMAMIQFVNSVRMMQDVE